MAKAGELACKHWVGDGKSWPALQEDQKGVVAWNHHLQERELNLALWWHYLLRIN